MEWKEETMAHLTEHLSKWPTTGQEILEVCNNMMDVPDGDKGMIDKKINPEKTYNSLDEVMEDLNKEM
jgi:hypothetical protein